MKLPKIYHTVWLTSAASQIPLELVKILVGNQLILKRSAYRFIIWTNASHAVIRSLQTMAINLTYIEIKHIDLLFNDAQLFISGDAPKKLDRMTYINFLRHFHRELIGFANSSTAKDLLSCLILYVHGGVYADLDHQIIIRDSLSPFPTIETEFGFMICGSMLLASQNKHPYLVDVMQAMLTMLDKMDKQPADISRSVLPSHQFTVRDAKRRPNHYQAINPFAFNNQYTDDYDSDNKVTVPSDVRTALSEAIGSIYRTTLVQYARDYTINPRDLSFKIECININPPTHEDPRTSIAIIINKTCLIINREVDSNWRTSLTTSTQAKAFEW